MLQSPSGPVPREIFNFHHSYTTILDTTGGKSGLKTGTPSHSAHCHFGAQGANIDPKSKNEFITEVVIGPFPSHHSSNF